MTYSDGTRWIGEWKDDERFVEAKRREGNSDNLPIASVVAMGADVNTNLIVAEVVDDSNEPTSAPTSVLQAQELRRKRMEHFNNECTVCMNKQADFVIIPCGHQCACENCLNKIQRGTNKCPICRTTIENICRVYKCN